MNVKNKGLGKRLGSLIASTKAAEEKDLPQGLKELLIDSIVPGKYQPRRNFSTAELEGLAESIKQQGIVQPIVVRKIKTGYELVAGERRWRASKLAGLTTIPVVIKTLTDEQAALLALVENMQRENLNPLEEAEGIERLVQEWGLTHQEIADMLGKSRTAVTNLLRLLSLSPEVKNLIDNKKLELGHAKILAGIKGQKQNELARIIAEKAFSVRETENYIALLNNASEPTTTKGPIDPDIKRLQTKLSETLGASVKIMHANNGKGKIVIQYFTLDELEGILEKLT